MRIAVRVGVAINELDHGFLVVLRTRNGEIRNRSDILWWPYDDEDSQMHAGNASALTDLQYIERSHDAYLRRVFFKGQELRYAHLSLSEFYKYFRVFMQHSASLPFVKEELSLLVGGHGPKSQEELRQLMPVYG